MTKLTYWNKEVPKKREKPIDFTHILSSVGDWEVTANRPKMFKNIQVVPYGTLTLFICWDNCSSEPYIYKGNLNDGFVEE